jgi:hypothetical protein
MTTTIAVATFIVFYTIAIYHAFTTAKKTID